MVQKLEKKLGVFGLSMIAVGTVIGAGIFITPGLVAQDLPSKPGIIIVWICGGLIALCGALTFSELASLFPHAGGVFAYMKAVYGRFWGFMFGWSQLMVVVSGAIAAYSIAFVDYASNFVHIPETWKVPIAICIILLLSILNILGLDFGKWFSNVFGLLKILAIALIIIFAISYYFNAPESRTSVIQTNENFNYFSAFFLALIGVLWSFGGWHMTTFMAGEAKNASKSIPKALVLGVSIVILTYVLVNIAYMGFLSISEMKDSHSIASDSIGKYLSNGSRIVALMVMVSVFGSIGIMSLTGPRVYHAMAKEGIFFKSISKINTQFKTPVNAILIQSLWAIIILILGKTLKNIITYAAFIDIAFMCMCGFAVILWRFKHPKVERLVSVPFHPIVPLLFVIPTFIFLINTLIKQPVQALAGLGLIILGIPFYLYFKRKTYKQ